MKTRKLTKKDVERYTNLVLTIRNKPLNPDFTNKHLQTGDILQFIANNHLESEYNRISVILYKNGFIGANLILLAVYLTYCDVYKMEGGV